MDQTHNPEAEKECVSTEFYDRWFIVKLILRNNQKIVQRIRNNLHPIQKKFKSCSDKKIYNQTQFLFFAWNKKSKKQGSISLWFSETSYDNLTQKNFRSGLNLI